jgi:hypothetical protein
VSLLEYVSTQGTLQAKGEADREEAFRLPSSLSAPFPQKDALMEVDQIDDNVDEMHRVPAVYSVE